MELINTINGSMIGIRTMTKQVKDNKKQFHCLDKRIQSFQIPIDRLRNAQITVKPYLESFLYTLQECEKLLNDLVDASLFKRVFRHSAYHNKFKQLNIQLTQHANDLLLALMVSGVSHCQQPGTNDSRRTIQNTHPRLSTYIIKTGDTFWKLSKKHGCSLDAIMNANPGVNAECLSIGQAVNIPIGGEPQLDVNQDMIMKNKSQQEFLKEIISQSQCNDVVLREMGLTDADWPIIIENAIREKRCTSLFLNNNELTSIEMLAAELSNNTILETISLGGNSIKDDVSQLISNDNTTLVRLWLNETDLTDVGVRRLFNTLRTNKTLEGLYLHCNKLIADGCIYHMITMLEENQKLKNIWLYNCNLSEKSKKRLRTVVKKINKRNKQRELTIML